MKIKYQTTMINTGARRGSAVSPDGSFILEMASPIELGGDGIKSGTNPEQLFAATYSSCFGGALGLVLRQAKAEYESSRVSATIFLLEEPADKGNKLAAKIEVSIKGMPIEKAKKYAQLAHKICPYSKAILGNVDVEIVVV